MKKYDQGEGKWTNGGGGFLVKGTGKGKKKKGYKGTEIRHTTNISKN